MRDGLSEAEVYALMLTENVQRVPLEPIQAARALRLLLDLNEDMTAASLARWLGLRPAWAQLHLKLLDLPQEVQDRVEAGDLSVTIADILRRAQSTGRIDEDRVLDLAAKAARGEITSTQVKAEAGPPKTIAPKTVQMGQDGKPLVPDPKPASAKLDRLPGEARESKDWAAPSETTGAARLSPPSHPGADRMAEVEEQEHVPVAKATGDELADQLDSYLLGRALREWADDDYLDHLGIDRTQVETYASALNPVERVMALRHLSLVLMEEGRTLVGAH